MFRTIYFFILRMTGTPEPWTFIVLMYHSIRSEEVKAFSRQMDFLKNRTIVVGADFPESAVIPASRYVALTFDDGYEGFEHNVLPVLREKKIPATVFVPTGYLGKTPGWVSYEKSREFKERLLSEEKLRAMLKENFISIGSHSVSHSPLVVSALSVKDIRFELEESKRHLEAILGRTVELFALPYGTFDEYVLNLAKEAGYHRTFLSLPLGSFSNIDKSIAGRIAVSPNDSFVSFRLKALGCYQFLPIAIVIKTWVLNWINRIRFLIK